MHVIETETCSKENITEHFETEMLSSHQVGIYATPSRGQIHRTGRQVNVRAEVCHPSEHSWDF